SAGGSSAAGRVLSGGAGEDSPHPRRRLGGRDQSHSDRRRHLGMVVLDRGTPDPRAWREPGRRVPGRPPGLLPNDGNPDPSRKGHRGERRLKRPRSRRHQRSAREEALAGGGPEREPHHFREPDKKPLLVDGDRGLEERRPRGGGGGTGRESPPPLPAAPPLPGESQLRLFVPDPRHPFGRRSFGARPRRPPRHPVPRRQRHDLAGPDDGPRRRNGGGGAPFFSAPPRRLRRRRPPSLRRRDLRSHELLHIPTHPRDRPANGARRGTGGRPPPRRPPGNARRPLWRRGRPSGSFRPDPPDEDSSLRSRSHRPDHLFDRLDHPHHRRTRRELSSGPPRRTH